MNNNIQNDIERVDGRAKVTGAAKYAAEFQIPGLTYGVIVGSTITKGTITAIDTKAAERAPGVIRVITHLNALKVPGYEEGYNPAKGPVGGKGLQVFGDAYIRFNGEPVALVIANTWERAVHAGTLIKVQYKKEAHQTDLQKAVKSLKSLEGNRYNDYQRGEVDAYKNAPVMVEAEYEIPIEVHNPMELHATIAVWSGNDKVTVYEKTQGVKSAQKSIAQAFKLDEQNVQIHAYFVGGGFGAALRTWPHAIAAVMGAKMIGRPLKVVLGRDQMFNMVGYRPHAIQKIGIGASPDGKFTGITHEAYSHTSDYEEFTEGIVNVSRFLYNSPNVTTRYKVYPLDVSTPTWMRGPGEATGAFAIECAIDELAHKLNIDPLQLRLINYAETDPQRNLPFSSKYLKEAYEMGAEKIGWKNRNTNRKTEGDWVEGFGMAGGVFGAYRGEARALARFSSDGRLVIQSAVSDSGPGTATAMVQIAANNLGLPTSQIIFELGDSSFPPGPTQGGSVTTSTMGSAVHAVTETLKKKLFDLAKSNPVFHTATIHDVKYTDLVFENGYMQLAADKTKRLSLTDVLKQSSLPQIEVTEESKGGEELRKYASYSFSVHFVKVKVHKPTGIVRVDRVVSAVDAGKIISPKTAESQIIGGVVGGIGMALMEEGVIDHRYGRWVNNDFAHYHVPVHADVPKIEVYFTDKPDPITNPMGSKGIGEVSMVGFAPALANAVFHATGKRIRDLPITPDKLL